MPKLKRNKLTDKQQAFCREYVKNGYNGTQAVIKAGYSKKGADVQAARLLVIVRIKERIEHHRNHLEELCYLSKALILEEQKRIAFETNSTEPAERQKAIQSIVDILGYDAPTKTDVNFKTEQGDVKTHFPFAPPND